MAKILDQKIPDWLTGCAAFAVMAVMYVAAQNLHSQVLQLQDDFKKLKKTEQRLTRKVNEIVALSTLKIRDLNKTQEQLPSLAQSRKVLYESGLSLQAEKRLLEKQLEIMQTYLSVDPTVKKIALMRKDHSLKDFSVGFALPQAWGGMTVPLPKVVRIVSKERFAHPERGKAEMVNGSLAWEPPQVGTSLRSNALGEFVIFTNSGLILHGPPTKEPDHQAFPHYCLGLSKPTAMKLYQSTFIGNKIAFAASVAVAPKP